MLVKLFLLVKEALGKSVGLDDPYGCPDIAFTGKPNLKWNKVKSISYKDV